MPLLEIIRPPWEPPPLPPPRKEMIARLKNKTKYGPFEDFDNMTDAELWERYKPLRDLIKSLYTY